MKGIEGAGGAGGYSETEVGLRDRGEEGDSFGAIWAVEEAVVSGDAARICIKEGLMSACLGLVMRGWWAGGGEGIGKDRNHL